MWELQTEFQLASIRCFHHFITLSSVSYSGFPLTQTSFMTTGHNVHPFNMPCFVFCKLWWDNLSHRFGDYSGNRFMQTYSKIPYKYRGFLTSWASVVGIVVAHGVWNWENICETSFPHSKKSKTILAGCLLKPPLHLQEHKIKCPLKPRVCSISQYSKLPMGAWFMSSHSGVMYFQPDDLPWHHF